MSHQPSCGPVRAGRSRIVLLASLLAALSVLVPASMVQAAELPAVETRAVESSAVEVNASSAAPARASEEGSEPSPATTEQPTTPAPAAEAAQSPEDVAGGNEYTEEGLPTGTGDDDTSPPVDPGSDSGSSPTSSPQGTAGTSGAATQSQAAGNEDAAAVTSPASTLPRTGADAWLLALVGSALLSLGVILRRLGAPAPLG